MRLGRRRGVIIGGASALLILAIALLLPYLPDASEVRDLLLLKASPRRFKLRCLRLLSQDRREILMVGTLHSLHLTTAGYNLADLENLVINYQPDCVAIEARARDLSAGLHGMASLEMANLALLAAQRGTPSFGFDWWEEQQYAEAAERGQAIDYNDGRRNDQMVQRLLAGVTGCQRVIVFTGYSHLEPLVARLRAAGALPRPLARGTAAVMFTPRGGRDALSPALVEPLERSITHLRAYLDGYPRDNEWSRRLRRKLELLRRESARLGAMQGR